MYFWISDITIRFCSLQSSRFFVLTQTFFFLFHYNFSHPICRSSFIPMDAKKKKKSSRKYLATEYKKKKKKMVKNEMIPAKKGKYNYSHFKYNNLNKITSFSWIFSIFSIFLFTTLCFGAWKGTLEKMKDKKALFSLYN